MGYTHYWSIDQTGLQMSRDVNYTQFSRLAEQIITTAETQGYVLADGLGEKIGAWEVSGEMVRLNGLGDNAHETFSIEKDSTDSGGSFCKTARKPYDTVVTALLVALGHTYGTQASVATDGEPGDWEAGMSLFTTATGVKAKLPIR